MYESVGQLTPPASESEVAGARVLVVEDEASLRSGLVKSLEREGFDVASAARGDEGLACVQVADFDVVVSDLMMPGMDGMELLRQVRRTRPDTEVILITGYGTVERAVEAVKAGAHDFITKPLQRSELIRRTWSAIEKRRLRLENRNLRKELARHEGGARIVCTSPGMRELVDIAERIAPTSATALVLGETGTGKEVLARTIHGLSNRSDKPFVTLSCAALPESLLEAELFGFERGAFTGAARQKQGRFELADGGTLFLDEVGEIPREVQVKLLRFLQEGTLERLGGTRTKQLDVRLIAATNADLEKAVREGRFREDLYYRLNVVVLRLPPLRERVEDIPILAEVFLRKFACRNRKPVRGFAPGVTDVLLRHDWPGNVRELENAIERAVILCRGAEIGLSDLPAALGGSPELTQSSYIPAGVTLAELEQRALLAALRRAGGNKAEAARQLGVSTRTVFRKLEAMTGNGRPEVDPA
jgi:two-component system response regulator HydG